MFKEDLSNLFFYLEKYSISIVLKRKSFYLLPIEMKIEMKSLKSSSVVLLIFQSFGDR